MDARGSKEVLILELGGKTIKFTKNNDNGLYFILLKRMHSDNDGEIMNIDESSENNEHRDKRVRFSDEVKSDKNEGTLKNDMSMDINEAHRRWGHPGLSRMESYAKQVGITLKNEFEQCDACSVAKAKCNPIAKSTMTVAKRVGERICVDTSGPFPASFSGCTYWRAAVDDFSGKMFIEFGKTKSGMKEFVEKIFIFLKGRNTPCKFLRCDNAGEHFAFKELCPKYGVEIEFTPSYTPQFNGRLERRFPVVLEKGMAMMIDAGFKKEFRRFAWAEAVNTASFLCDIFPTARSQTPAYELFYEERCKWYNHLVEFGRVGIVASKKKGIKLQPKGEPMIMLGYSLTHKVGSYRMYNPRSRKVVIYDNVAWTTAKQWQASDDMKENLQHTKIPRERTNSIPDMTPLNIDDDESYDDNDDNAVPMQTNMKDKGISRMVKELDTSYNNINDLRVTGDTNVNQVRITRSQSSLNMVIPDIYDVIAEDGIAVYDSTNEGGETVQHNIHFCYNTSVQSDPGEPKSFKQAMQSTEKEWWTRAVKSEINNFLKRNAWKFLKRSEVANKGRRPIPTKHVFKKKIELDSKTGKEYVRFKDRIVTLGFMQIPGVDYTESFSPVVTDTGLRIVFGLVLFHEDDEWICVSYNVEAAFLEPSMKGLEMFIEIPEGLKEFGFISSEDAKDHCILLEHSMYGNVDAALRWIITKTEYLTGKSIGMIQSKADPCIFYKRDNKGNAMLVLAITVDDCAVGGKPEAIEWLLAKIEERFKITRGGRIRKHLGVDYKWSKDEEGETCLELWMERKREDIIKTYEDYTKKTCKVRVTPGAPGSVLKKNEGKEIDIEKYRSMVGKLMFYGTKVCPKIVNATRELATHMSNPGEDHWKAVGHLVGYLKSTLKGPAMILRRPKELRIVSYVDASYGNSGEGRRSVSGELHTLGGMITAFSSRTQKTVSLSSAESEYIAASSAAKEVMFQQMLLSEICENVIPGVIYEDNEGAIFLSKNKQVSQRTKHIDVRYHFLRDFTWKGNNSCEKGKLMKVDGKLNYADLMTKNTDGTTFKFLGEDIDKGMTMLRDNYDEDIIQKLGGMSEVEKLEVTDDVSGLNHWIRHVRNKKEDESVLQNNIK